MVEDAVGGHVAKCSLKNLHWCLWRGIRVFFNATTKLEAMWPNAPLRIFSGVSGGE